MVGSATVPKLIYDPIREGERYIYCYIESIDICIETPGPMIGIGRDIFMSP